MSLEQARSKRATTPWMLTVSGAVADATLDMDVVTTNPISRYKLKLDLSGDCATGAYHALSANGDSWTGSAEGERTT